MNNSSWMQKYRNCTVTATIGMIIRGKYTLPNISAFDTNELLVPVKHAAKYPHTDTPNR